jgi:hypothetical protein
LPLAEGVNRNQMLFDTFAWHDGAGGSPVVVASVMSKVARHGKDHSR